MKAKCVNNDDLAHLLSIGKTYDCLLDKDGDVVIICDNGYREWFPRHLFELLPDEKPSEWMRISDDEYVNINTGMKLYLWYDDGGKHARLSNIQNNGDHFAHGYYADAFAALVGYDWKEG